MFSSLSSDHMCVQYNNCLTLSMILDDSILQLNDMASLRRSIPPILLHLLTQTETLMNQELCSFSSF